MAEVPVAGRWAGALAPPVPGHGRVRDRPGRGADHERAAVRCRSARRVRRSGRSPTIRRRRRGRLDARPRSSATRIALDAALLQGVELFLGERRLRHDAEELGGQRRGARGEHPERDDGDQHGRQGARLPADLKHRSLHGWLRSSSRWARRRDGPGLGRRLALAVEHDADRDRREDDDRDQDRHDRGRATTAFGDVGAGCVPPRLPSLGARCRPARTSGAVVFDAAAFTAAATFWERLPFPPPVPSPSLLTFFGCDFSSPSGSSELGCRFLTWTFARLVTWLRRLRFESCSELTAAGGRGSFPPAPVTSDSLRPSSDSASPSGPSDSARRRS